MAGAGFSAAEREAMKQRAEELRTTKGLKGAAKKARELEACLDAIDALSGTDLELATMLHRIVTEVAPDLTPRTMYGFPTYAREGRTVVFFQPASKFDTRYATISFDEAAALDDGVMWATSYAVLEADEEVERTVRRLLRKAVG
ncbi:hypothetical protein AVL62_06215 [Serinicoccus chungangensis]|uniref:YdhG-like domain-containing protein n=1 Tax=Serinicoccus chungangensis TaxID=767452 RepID=A0A0W8IH19_9MICO|nr:hypothetical protein [Serinicoccus chungangensis]KUG59274.1 hypothetical protein AVL62_06215 [Serinicoccus chungangensis]